MYYFGCWHGAGHYFYAPDGQKTWKPTCPIDAAKLDGGFLPKSKEQPEGVVTHVVVDGWTIIAFWDRSGDIRFNSNSAFVMQAMLSKEQAIATAREVFPAIFARFKFELK